MVEPPVELRYNKQELFWLAFLGPLLVLLTGAIALHPPPSIHLLYYRLLYLTLEPAGISLVFAVLALLCAAMTVEYTRRILGDGVAARVTTDGVVVRRWFGVATLAWADLRRIEQGVTRVRGREHRFLRLRYRTEPGAAAERVIGLAERQLFATEQEIAAWAASVRRGMAQAAVPAPPAPTRRAEAPPPRGFGRRSVG